MQPGMYAAMTGRYPKIETGSAAMDALVDDAMYDPEFSVQAMVGGVERETVETFRFLQRHYALANAATCLASLDAHLAARHARLVLEPPSSGRYGRRR